MTKRKVPKVIIDDGLLIMKELTRQGLLDLPIKPVQPQAVHMSTKRDDHGEEGRASGKCSGGNYTNL
jgi:hypothetical protein